MSQTTKLLLAFLVFLGAITIAHGGLNLEWFTDTTKTFEMDKDTAGDEVRENLTVAHLPVT